MVKRAISAEDGDCTCYCDDNHSDVYVLQRQTAKQKSSQKSQTVEEEIKGLPAGFTCKSSALQNQIKHNGSLCH